MQEAPQSWSELWALEPGVYSWVQQTPLDWQPADTNSGLLRVELTIHSSGQSGGSHSFILSYIDGVNYLKRYFGEPTRDGNGLIAPIATATPPQEYDLPLADGWTAHRRSVYFKTQENIVIVCFQVKNETAQSGEVTLATLPAGFRPKTLIGGSGYCATFANSYYITDTKVYPNGDISGYNVSEAVNYYTGFFTFVADS